MSNTSIVHRDSISRIVTSHWPCLARCRPFCNIEFHRYACQSPTTAITNRGGTVYFDPPHRGSCERPIYGSRARCSPSAIIRDFRIRANAKVFKKVRRSVYDCFREMRSMKRTHGAI